MTIRRLGLIAGPALFLLIQLLVPEEAMPAGARSVAAVAAMMAILWMTEALPLTATALMPFLVLPFAGVMNARETASAYYSPILFLLLGAVLNRFKNNMIH